jgi:hypothetical protein
VASTEPEKQMQHLLAVDLGVRLENEGCGGGDPAFLCGVPFRGNERHIRDAGSSLPVPARRVAGALVEVIWWPPVSWEKRIRFPKPNDYARNVYT